MPEKSERSLQMLAIALEMEAKGQDYYQKAMDSCGNHIGREVFKMLRDYEVQHVARIKAIYDSLKSGRPWSAQLASFEIPESLGTLFRSVADRQPEHCAIGTGDVEALNVGIDFEQASVRFYTEQLALADDPLEKRFLDLMINEERQHLQILTDMRYYYEDPESWYLEKDRAGLDGA